MRLLDNICKIRKITLQLLSVISGKQQNNQLQRTIKNAFKHTLSYIEVNNFKRIEPRVQVINTFSETSHGGVFEAQRESEW